MPSPGLQTVTIPCKGGLNLSATNQELLGSPNESIILENFEPSKTGGNRRISGYAEWGDLSVPGTGEIKGIHTYRGGVIVAKGVGLYHSFDGTAWTKVNKLVSGVNNATLVGTADNAELSTVAEKTVKMEVYTEGTDDHLYISTGNGNPAYLLIEGTSEATATYTFRWVSLGTELEGAKELVIFEQQVILANTTEDPTSLIYSSFATTDLSAADVSAGLTVREKYDGSTSGQINFNRPITGIRAHRNSLYVFTRKGISKVQNLRDGNVVVEPLTEDIGCVDGNTIQEIEGDLIFLAADGLRTISQTERFEDVEMGVISRKVSQITDDILNSLDNYTFASAVIRKKSQYRLWYRSVGLTDDSQKALVAAYSYDSATSSFRWDFSEIKGWVATAAYSGEDENGVELSVHGDASGKAYQFEFGSSFDGSPIPWDYQMPYTDFGDIGVRKNLHSVLANITPEGSLAAEMLIRYDYSSFNTPQPDAYTMEQQTRPAIYGDPLTVYGNSSVLYGSASFNKGEVYAQGSGFTCSVRIKDTGQEDASFSIESLELDFVMNGRV